MDPAQRANVEILNELEARPFNGAGGVILPFGASTVVWRPGGVSSGNVYATWAEVVAAVAALNGAITIAVDDSLAAAVIPAGAWDLRPAGISGPVTLVNGNEAAPFGAFITIAHAAVTIHGLTGMESVSIDNQSTSNVITADGTHQPTFRMNFAAIYQNVLAAGAAFLKVNAGSTSTTLILDDGSFVSTLGGGSNAIQVTGAAFAFTLEINDGSFLDASMLVSAIASSTAVFVGGSSFLGTQAYGTQVGAPSAFPNGMVQRGSAAIVVGTGKTAAISAFMRAATVIVVSLKTPVGDALTVKYAALDADRANGFPGTLQISALAAAGGGAVNGADTSTIDWEVVN